MSGENVLAFFRKPKLSPLEERLDVESDQRLFGSMGSGSVFGIAFFAFALTLDPAFIPRELYPDPPADQKPEPFRDWGMIPDAAYHGKISDLKKKLAKHPPKPGTPGLQASKPKSRHPTEKTGAIKVAVIPSRTSLGGLSAYDLLPPSMRHNDMLKTDELPTLTRTGPSRLGGRKGKFTTEYNTAYNEGGTGGEDGIGIDIPRLTNTRPAAGPKGPSEIGKQVAIDHFENTTTRSTASILAVIRSHSPGLRHIYNTFLKMRPGLAGKITLRFAIAPSGQVVDVGLAGSTTSAPDFDAQVVRKVMTWRFEPVKAVGNDIVTVPFNFSE
jgi:TonB family protein